MQGVIVIAALSLASSISSAREPEIHERSIIRRTVKTNVVRQPELTLLLRPFQKWKTPPRAVVAFCTWDEKPQSVQNRLLNENFPPVKFAINHKLPILSWTTATLWRTGVSFNQLSRTEHLQFDRDFDRITAAWENGANSLCREFGVPSNKMLLYGLSRGAHWSQRLGLRRPSKFLAVHVHVGGSYDRPTQRGSRTVWFISTGDLDPGHRSARNYYERTRELGYPALFKQYRGLGHNDCPELYPLQAAVFRFAMEADQAAGSAWAADRMTSTKVAGQAIDQSAYVGDALNESVLPSERAQEIPATQRIPIPNREIALVWGRLRD
jgi:hypothetical protein